LIIVPKLLKDEDLLGIKTRVDDLVQFWKIAWAYDTLDEMPQYVRDLVNLVGHIDASKQDEKENIEVG
jgi:hypothetical protein